MKVTEFYEQVDKEIIKYYKSSKKKDYYVSVFGEAYSVLKTDKNRVRKLKKSITENNYYIVGIPGSTKLLHRIVAKVFINNEHPELYNEVHHKNSNRTDNRVTNLQWVNRSLHQDIHREEKDFKYNYDGSFNYDEDLVKLNREYEEDNDPWKDPLLDDYDLLLLEYGNKETINQHFSTDKRYIVKDDYLIESEKDNYIG